MARVLLSLLAGLLAAAPGCAQELSEEPLTAERLDAFGAEFEERVNAGDSAWLRSVSDTQALFDRAVGDRVDDPLADSSPVEFVRTLIDQGAWSDVLFADIADNGCRLLRSELWNDEGRLFLRLRHESVMFCELVVRERDGELRIVDAFPYPTGELVSETMGAFVDWAEFEAEQAGSQYVSATSDAFARASELSRVAVLIDTDPEEVLRILDSWPAVLGGMRVFLNARVSAATWLDEDVYRDAMRVLAEYVPEGDPCRDMLIAETYHIVGDYEEGLAAVGRLQERVGPEGWLTSLRGEIQLEMGELGAALATGDEAFALEPELIDVHSLRVPAALGLGSPEQVLRVLMEYEEYFYPDEEWLGQLDGYAAFLDTPEGAEWRRVLGG